MYRIMLLLSAALVLAFAAFVCADLTAYNPMSTSAPFYVNIIIRALEFLLPALILRACAFIVKRKGGKKKWQS